MVYSPDRSSRLSKEEWQKQKEAALKNPNDASDQARSSMIAKNAEQQQGVLYHDVDTRWEAMTPVLEQKVPVWVIASELSQIQAAMTCAELQHVKLVIVGGDDAWRIGGQLKAKNIPVILTSMFAAPPHRWDPYDVVFATPRKLMDEGTSFCIAGDGDASNARNVQNHAAIAAAYGLSKDDALKSVTLSVALILGIADRVGSLETGKDATFMITNGDPLSQETTVEQVFIQGRKTDMWDRHKQLYDKYREKYRQLHGQ
jgi:imidazolonepropionase-like amidohydrolase